jgi:Tol biopolymer transport system component/DNA-binding winged helix-turn-helix (wHTH) protein
MSNQVRQFYAFGPFRLVSAKRILLHDGQPVPLAPKAVDILLVLVENAGQLVEKAELMQRVWPDAFVEEGNLTKNIHTLRKLLGNGLDGREYVETVPKRGYRFVAQVSELPVPRPWVVADGVRSPEREINSALPVGLKATDPVPASGSSSAQDVLPARPDPVHSEVIELPPRAGAEKPAEVDHPQPVTVSTPTRRALWNRRNALLVLAAQAAALLLWHLRPVSTPKVLSTVQLTHFGRVDAWNPLASDGRELYFEQSTGGSLGIERVPAEGGDATPVATPFPNTTLHDISPDGLELLVGSASPGQDERPLWVLPTSGGSPRRMGRVIAHDAAWSPDGRRIIYASGPDLYLAKADGSESKKLITTAGWPHWPRWSPDSRIVRFTLEKMGSHTLSLWEASVDGRNVHPLLPGWRTPPNIWGEGESGGEWTADGKYFIFRSERGNHTSLWAMRENPHFYQRSSSAPMLLATTDLTLLCPLIARNGKRIFFSGSRSRRDRELDRYDARLRQFVPYLGGPPASWVSFSPDGKWVAYNEDLNTAAGALWRSRVDGTDRQQLTFGMAAWLPRWSPDGKRIAFAGSESGGKNRIYLLPSDGGTPEPLTPEGDDPAWSPDGNSLLFAVVTPGIRIDTWRIFRVDLRTHHITPFPGSVGLRAPVYSPDGKHVAAIAWGGGLMLFDFHSQRWTQLTEGSFLNNSVWSYWSRDSKYIYGQDVLAGADQPVFRVRISDGKVEVVATRQQFARTDVKSYSLSGLTPDGAPLVSMIRSEDEIYALDVDLP